MIPSINTKRLLVGFAGVLLAIPLLWLLGLAISTHGIRLWRVAMDAPPPGAGIVVPEPPLPNDDAFGRLESIGRPVHELIAEPWLSAKCVQKDREDAACLAILQRHLDQLAAFDKWVDSQNKYGLERPPDLGRHSRVEGIANPDPKSAGPNFLSLQTLGQLLHARAVKRLSNGDAVGAEQDLRKLFALAEFLQQNPSLIELMIGVGIQGMGLSAIVSHWPTTQPPAHLEELLPSRERLVDGLGMAIGADWLFARSALQLQESPGERWSKWIGLYDEDDSLRVASKPYLLALDLIKTSTWEKEFGPLEECEPFGGPDPFPRYLLQPNPMGRLTACMVYPNWHHYANRVAYMHDAAEGTKLVLAARRYRREHGAWPKEDADLIPKYLKAWPISLRTGEPLSWLGNRQGVQLTGWPCGDSRMHAVCEFPFSPTRTME